MRVGIYQRNQMRDPFRITVEHSLDDVRQCTFFFEPPSDTMITPVDDIGQDIWCVRNESNMLFIISVLIAKNQIVGSIAIFHDGPK